MSLLVAVATYIAAFYPGYALPRWVMVTISVLAWIIAPYDLYRKQHREIEELKSQKNSIERQIAETELKEKREDEEVNALAERIWDFASKQRDPGGVTLMESQLPEQFHIKPEQVRKALLLLERQKRAIRGLPGLWTIR